MAMTGMLVDREENGSKMGADKSRAVLRDLKSHPRAYLETHRADVREELRLCKGLGLCKTDKRGCFVRV